MAESQGNHKAHCALSPLDHCPALPIALAFLETAVSYILSNFTVFFNSGRSLVPVALSCLEKEDGVSFKDHIHSSGDSKHFFIESHTKGLLNWKDLRIWDMEIWQSEQRGQDAREGSAENLTVYARTIIIPGVQAKDMIEKIWVFFIWILFASSWSREPNMRWTEAFLLRTGSQILVHIRTHQGSSL